MTWELVGTIVVALLGGGALKTLIDWLRFRDKDKADTSKLIHDSTSQALSISSTLLAQWIQSASIAEAKLSELRQEKTNMNVELKEVEHALGLCRDSMKRCQEKHGCE